MPFTTPIASDTIPGRITRPIAGRYFGDTSLAAIALDAVAEAHHSGELDPLIDVLKDLLPFTGLDFWPSISDLLDEVWDDHEDEFYRWLAERDLTIGSRKTTIRSNFSVTIGTASASPLVPGTILQGKIGGWMVSSPGAVVLLTREDQQGYTTIWCRLIPTTSVSRTGDDSTVLPREV